MDGMVRILALGLLTLVVNIPMGYWRSVVRKFSLQWFIAVHVFVPLVIMMRLSGGISDTSIPIFVAAALLGQAAGARVCRLADTNATRE